MTDNPYQEPTEAAKASGCSWRVLATTLAIIVVLIALLLPAVRRDARPAARATQCRFNMERIGLALHQYHDVYGSFPPAYTVDSNGRRLHSWRTLILPHLDQMNVYNAIDLSKPWNDSANDTAYETTIPAYTCPSVEDLPPGYTTYLGLVGQDCCFPPKGSRTLSEFAHTSTTLAAIEVPTEGAVHWMEPQDTDEDLFMTLGDSIEYVHSYAMLALCADGGAISVAPDMTPMERRNLLSVSKVNPGSATNEFNGSLPRTEAVLNP